MKRKLTLLAMLLVVSSQMMAATFVVPTDEELVAKAAAIVIGTVEGSYVQEANGTIETVYEIRAERAMKGAAAHDELLRVVALGGAIGDRGVIVPGEAYFRQGERVLLFLNRDARGRWRTTDLTLGRFAFRTSTTGERVLVREMEDVVGWDRSGRPHHEMIRKEAGFLRFIEDRAARRAPAADDYTVDSAQVTLAPAESGPTLQSNASGYAPATYTDWVSSQPTRWPNIAAGVTFYKRSDQNISGAADGGVSTIQNGLAAWTNECGSVINLVYGGQLAKASANHDATNVVEFNDPQQRISGSWTGSGTVAITFLSYAGEHTFLNQPWWNITDADVVFQDGYTAANAAFAAAMTHELGHAIGWRHSNQGHLGGACDPSVEECTSAAIMNSSVSSAYGFTLQPYDINAAQSVYPGGTCGPTCTAPAITSQPQSQTITPGQTATLSVGASGTSLTYQWYVGSPGNTSQPIAGQTAPTFSVSPAATTTYWVRVSNSCGAANSVAATVTVQAACTPPSITAQPQSQTITYGQTATLSVTATGTNLTYQWYVGNPGDTSQPIAGQTARTFSTSPASTSTYWVRVANACGAVNSTSATVTVTAACTAPAITAQPQSQTIAYGQTATLSVTATGTNLTYQWYVGNPGDTSQPIAGQTARTFSTSPASTSTYWVRVANACGSVNSTSATVTVTAACAAPSITTQPTSRSISSGQSTTLTVAASGTAPLSYQWYTGTSGNTASPISGATSSSLTVSPTSTTSYWVRVTNSCGSANSSTATVTVTTTPPPPTGARRVRADFDADRASELMLRNSANQLAMWDFSGRTVIDSSNFATVSSSSWRIEGFGDFNADGYYDILFRSVGGTQVAIWLMRGRTVLSSGLAGTLPSTAWNFEAFGDFNGDGRTDAIARNPNTGEVAMWEFNGTAVVSNSVIQTVGDLNWRIQGAGDFNADGKDELIWRHLSTQQMAMWEFSGRTISNGSVFATAPGTSWVVLGIGDFDGDGRSDILWQNTSTLDVTVWDMDYRTVVATVNVVRVGSSAWVVDAIGDYDGDGSDEIIWFNASTRQVAMWDLSASHTLVNGGIVATVPGDYVIQPPFDPVR